MPRLEGREGDGQIVAQPEPGETAEVGEAFALFLSHVIAIRQIHGGDRGIPLAAAGLVARDCGDRVPDVVVIVDRVECFLLDAARAASARPRLQQRRVEDLLLRRGVQFKERRQPCPDGTESSGVATIDLLQDREEPALFVMVVEDQLGYVHEALQASMANLQAILSMGSRSATVLTAPDSHLLRDAAVPRLRRRGLILARPHLIHWVGKNSSAGLPGRAGGKDPGTTQVRARGKQGDVMTDNAAPRNIEVKGAVARSFNNSVRWLTRHGISIWGSRVLAVRGRTSGEWRTTPVNPLSYNGNRYLVAPRGHTQWVKNMRVAGGGELRIGRRVERFTATELPDAQKPEVLRAYLKRWKFEVGVFFDGVGADASDEKLLAIAPGYPVFLITAR